MDSWKALRFTIHQSNLCTMLVMAGKSNWALLGDPGQGLKCMLRISRYVQDEMPSKNVCVLPRKEKKKHLNHFKENEGFNQTFFFYFKNIPELHNNSVPKG